MTYPYDFGGFGGGGSFPSLPSSGWSMPSTADWGSGLSGGILGGAGQGGSWDLPSLGSSSGSPSSFPSLSSLGSGWGSSQSMGGNDYPMLGLGTLGLGGTGSSQSMGGNNDPFASWFSGGSSPATGGGFQPGGILGGAGQGSQQPYDFSKPLSSLFAGGGGLPGSGQTAGAPGGFQMPGGFTGGIFGVNQNAQSPTYTSGGQAPQQTQTYNAQNGGIKSSAPTTNAVQTTASSTPTQAAQDYDSKMRAKYGDPKGAGQYGSPEEAAWNAGRTASSKNTLAYDTNNKVYGNDSPPKQASQPAPSIPAKSQGTPVGVTQKSTPVVQTQPQPPAADVEKQRRDSGYYLQ